jgi:uncharacterized SAM-binding protein YcdF (DUF218 family)
MTKWWVESGYQATALREEVDSLTTRENALRVAELCAGLGYRHVALVTCDFHMKRAERLFRKQQLTVTPVPAFTKRSQWQRLRLAVREWGAGILGKVDAWIR